MTAASGGLFEKKGRRVRLNNCFKPLSYRVVSKTANATKTGSKLKMFMTYEFNSMDFQKNL